MYVFLNNDFVPAEKATLHINDLAIHRGYGIFDFLKIQQNHPLFLDEYLNRFYNSAQIMRLQVPLTRHELKSVVFSLIEKNDIPQSGIKLILTGGYSEDGYLPGKPNLIIAQQSLSLPGPEIFEKGIRVITHEYLRDIPEVKTINYTTGIWLSQKIKEQKAADVLYHLRGEVSEFPRCNFFIVRQDGVLVTPRKNILLGITRKNVLTAARKKFTVEESLVSLTDVAHAKEAFLTSTTKRVIPVIQVDDSIIGNGRPGEITQELLKEIIVMEKNELGEISTKNLSQ